MDIQAGSDPAVNFTERLLKRVHSSHTNKKQVTFYGLGPQLSPEAEEKACCLANPHLFPSYALAGAGERVLIDGAS